MSNRDAADGLPPPWLVVAAGGTVETSFLPQRLFNYLADFSVRVTVALSPGARDFVTTTALAAITGEPVYTRGRQLDASQRPLHLALAEADRLLLCPASARIVASCALGLVTCPVTRLFAFIPPARVIVSPAIHPAMDRSVYAAHLATLRNRGCTVLGGDDLFASWQNVRDHLERTFPLARRTDATGVLSIGRR